MRSGHERLARVTRTFALESRADRYDGAQRFSAGGISVLDLWGGIIVAKFVCSESCERYSRDFYSICYTMCEVP